MRSRSARSQMEIARSRMAARVCGSMKAPPPVDSTCTGLSSRRKITRQLANSGPRRYRNKQDEAERRLMRLVTRGLGEWCDPPRGPASGRLFVLKPNAGCGYSENTRQVHASASTLETEESDDSPAAFVDGLVAGAL